MIYLDNAATTKISPVVLDAMMPYLKDEYGNAGSIYGIGRHAAEAITKARAQVANLIGAKPEQIIFTSGGTEANNLAIHGTKRYLNQINKKHIITSKIEHPSVLKAVESLCTPLQYNDKKYIKDGFYASYLSVDIKGCISIEELEEKVQENTGLVSIMSVNNEVGSVNPVRHIGEFCRKNDILFHTDCVQAVSSYGLNVDDILCDFMSISSHKLHGPKGIGALYVRDKEELHSIINGSDEQEFGLRGGTLNVAGIVGFGEACEQTLRHFKENTIKVLSLKKCFYNRLWSNLYNTGIIKCLAVNGTRANDYGRVLSLTFKNVDAETLVLMLDARGVCVSAGAACHSHESHPSHVLTAIGLSEEDARSSIRVSFSEFNEASEVEAAADIISECVCSLSYNVNDIINE